MRSEKPTWDVRAKEFGYKITEFLAEHGTNLSLAGGTILTVAGVATLLSSGLQTTPEAVEALQSASTAMFIGGFIKMAAGATAEAIAKVKIHGVDALFSNQSHPHPADFTKSHPSSQKGATSIDDALLQDPDFRKAMLVVTTQLSDAPKSRASISDILRSSPGARQVLIELQREHGGMPSETANPDNDQLDEDQASPSN